VEIFEVKRAFEKLALFVVVFTYGFFQFILDSVKFLLFWRLKLPRNTKKILIYRIGNVGDTICAVPSIIAIRDNFPKGEITMLTSPGKTGALGPEELLNGSELIDELIVYYQEDIKGFARKIDLIRKLRERAFDVFIELPQELTNLRTEIRNIVFAMLIGVKYACGFRTTAIHLFKKIQAKHLKFERQVERLLDILKKEGLKIHKVCLSLPISKDDEKQVDEFLRESAIQDFIAVDPNAKIQTKLWPLDRFGEVGRRLVKDYNVNVMIIGGQADKKRTGRLREMIGRGAIDVSGRFSLLQTLELLRRCLLLVSNDTGSVHMAASVETPVVGIYSARDFAVKWYPYGAENIILRKNVSCSICYKFTCENPICLEQITVEEVLGAVRSRMKEVSVKA